MRPKPGLNDEYRRSVSVQVSLFKPHLVFPQPVIKLNEISENLGRGHKLAVPRVLHFVFCGFAYLIDFYKFGKRRIICQSLVYKLLHCLKISRVVCFRIRALLSFCYFTRQNIFYRKT